MRCDAEPAATVSLLYADRQVVIGDLIRELRLPIPEIFLVLRNGRDVTPGIYQGGVVKTEVALDDGDVIAFSGPVPYSWAYGAPVV